MTPLRQRMIEDMQLRGYSRCSQVSYFSAVRQLAKYYRKPPDQITEEELRKYFLYLTMEKGVAPGTRIVSLSAFKFLYQQTLHRRWAILDMACPRRAKKLPIVLSVEEVHQVLKRLHSRPRLHQQCLHFDFGRTIDW